MDGTRVPFINTPVLKMILVRQTREKTRCVIIFKRIRLNEIRISLWFTNEIVFTYHPKKWRKGDRRTVEFSKN